MTGESAGEVKSRLMRKKIELKACSEIMIRLPVANVTVLKIT
jgi:hypothetical protein